MHSYLPAEASSLVSEVMPEINEQSLQSVMHPPNVNSEHFLQLDIGVANMGTYPKKKIRNKFNRTSVAGSNTFFFGLMNNFASFC